MRWEKLGLIFSVKKNSIWMHSHAALPIPAHLHDDQFRIYFSTRDTQNRSHGAFVDIDLKIPHNILNISANPVLSPGVLGLFDDSGVSLSCYIKENRLFYYLGWNILTTVPFANFIGAAKDDNYVFKKISVLPIIDRCEQEPFSCGYPWIMVKDGIYRMWYDTNIAWAGNSTADYKFALRYAESQDGLVWSRKFIDCLHMEPFERSISRPCVLFEDGKFKMWYSVNQSGKYHIGYAESDDGMKWVRKDDEVGITVSESGWDSEEIEYPCVFDHKGERYMLYNGNGYGRTGFGLAKLIKN